MRDRNGKEIDERKNVYILLGNMQRIPAVIVGDVAKPFPFFYHGRNGSEFIDESSDKMESFIIEREEWSRKIITGGNNEQ